MSEDLIAALQSSMAKAVADTFDNWDVTGPLHKASALCFVRYEASALAGNTADFGVMENELDFDEDGIYFRVTFDGDNTMGEGGYIEGAKHYLTNAIVRELEDGVNNRRWPHDAPINEECREHADMLERHLLATLLAFYVKRAWLFGEPVPTIDKLKELLR